MTDAQGDVLEIRNFLDHAVCDALRADLQKLDGRATPLLGQDGNGRAEPSVRKATRIMVPAVMSERMVTLLLERKPALEEHFSLTLAACEEPQFLRYRTGDFFVPHQDGNTPLIYDRSRSRRISVVIFVNRQSHHPVQGGYGGGSLVMHGHYRGPERRVPVAASPGMLVAFRAEMTHEVTPITHGERFTIVSWFH